MATQSVTVWRQEALVGRLMCFTELAVKSLVGCHLGFDCNVHTDGQVVTETPFEYGLVTNWVNDRKVERLIIQCKMMCVECLLRGLLGVTESWEMPFPLQCSFSNGKIRKCRILHTR